MSSPGDPVLPPGTAEVLAHVSRETSGVWRVVGPLGGGYQSGATQVISDGHLAVLKWSPRPAWAPRFLGAAAIVAFARAQGYPTPAWIAWGTTDEGFPYVLYEYLEGDMAERLDSEVARAHLGLVERQVGMNPPSTVEWSTYVIGSVFDDLAGDKERLKRLGGPPAQAVARVESLVEPFRGEELSMVDLVHGDLSLGNFIFHGGGLAGVVDIEAVGRGTAAYDLAAGLRTAYMDGADPPVRDWLESAAVDLFGPAALAICVGIQVIEILTFGLRKWPENVPDAASRLITWVKATERLIV